MAAGSGAPALGAPAPRFALRDTEGRVHTTDDLRGPKGLVLMFICNHCPYVLAVVERIVAEAAALRALGFGVAAICANDATTHPADSFENMGAFAGTASTSPTSTTPTRPSPAPPTPPARRSSSATTPSSASATAAASTPAAAAPRRRRAATSTRPCASWPRPARAPASRPRRSAARSSGRRHDPPPARRLKPWPG